VPSGSARCGHPAGAAAGCSGGNARPGERPGEANATTVMAMAAVTAIAASAYRRAARYWRSLVSSHPCAGPVAPHRERDHAGSVSRAAAGG
jgi:hypothetical protein